MGTSSRGGQAGVGRAEWLEMARGYLRTADPVLARLIADRPDFDPRRWMTELPPMDLFGALLFQIVGQQLSVAATLIIALGREDVVLPGDLALRKAVRATYRLDHLPTQEEVLAIAEKWRPYRSLATSYLFSAAFEEVQRLTAGEGHGAALAPEAEPRPVRDNSVRR
jgi:3-methyladenine DNA glycosylase/8-oxoguanine DNA glycosylase